MKPHAYSGLEPDTELVSPFLEDSEGDEIA
jgi:hypothetical protein